MSDGMARRMRAALKNHGVGAVYCINLPRRTDRRRFMAHKCREVGFDDVRWWPAIDGREPRWRSTFEAFHERALPTGIGMDGITPGALGLLLTWRSWVDHVLDEGHARVVLLEDDGYFHRDFLPRFAEEVPRDAPIVYLGGHQWGRCDTQAEAIAAGRSIIPVSPILKVCGTFGLLMSHGFLSDFGAVLRDRERWDAPIDGLIWRYQCDHPEQRGSMTRPPLLVPEVRESNNMGPREIDAFCAPRGLDFSLYRGVELFERFIGTTQGVTP